MYKYIYILGGKRQINYKFIPTSLFRGCPLIRGFKLNPLMSGDCVEHCITKVKILHFINIYIYVCECVGVCVFVPNWPFPNRAF